jgi:hypothetical protein
MENLIRMVLELLNEVLADPFQIDEYFFQKKIQQQHLLLIELVGNGLFVQFYLIVEISQKILFQCVQL